MKAQRVRFRRRGERVSCRHSHGQPKGIDEAGKCHCAYNPPAVLPPVRKSTQRKSIRSTTMMSRRQVTSLVAIAGFAVIVTAATLVKTPRAQGGRRGRRPRLENRARFQDCAGSVKVSGKEPGIGGIGQLPGQRGGGLRWVPLRRSCDGVRRRRQPVFWPADQGQSCNLLGGWQGFWSLSGGGTVSTHHLAQFDTRQNGTS